MENETICPKCNRTEMAVAYQDNEGQLYQEGKLTKSWLGSIQDSIAIGRLNHVICKNCGFVVYSFMDGYKNLK